MAYETILYDVADKVLTITLNRPDKLNSFTATMQAELIDAFDRADKDDNVRAIIVTGAGRGFCAGADLSSGSNTFDRAARGRAAPVKADGGEVGAGAEAAPRAGDDDRPHIVVLVGAVECVDQLRLHRGGEGIELVRPVQRDGEDLVGNVIENGFVRHPAISRVSCWGGRRDAIRVRRPLLHGACTRSIRDRAGASCTARRRSAAL